VTLTIRCNCYLVNGKGFPVLSATGPEPRFRLAVGERYSVIGVRKHHGLTNVTTLYKIQLPCGRKGFVTNLWAKVDSPLASLARACESGS